MESASDSQPEPPPSPVSSQLTTMSEYLNAVAPPTFVKDGPTKAKPSTAPAL